MAVIIPMAKMPNNCEECDLKGLCPDYWTKIREEYTRPSWCPLVEVADRKTESIPNDDYIETRNDYLEAKCLECNNSKACKENHWEGCRYEPLGYEVTAVVGTMKSERSE